MQKAPSQPCNSSKSIHQVHGTSSLLQYLRLQNILIFPYIGNWLLVGHSHRKAQWETCFTLALLRDLGLTVNEQKSSLKPARTVHYIGALIDSIQARPFLPTDKRQNLITLLQGFTPHALILAWYHNNNITGFRHHGLYDISHTTCTAKNETSPVLVSCPIWSINRTSSHSPEGHSRNCLPTLMVAFSSQPLCRAAISTTASTNTSHYQRQPQGVGGSLQIPQYSRQMVSQR